MTGGDLPVPISLAGYSMRMMVRKKASSASALIDISTANELIVIDFGIPGAFNLRIPLSELSVLSEGVYEHSLIGIRSDGIREQIWYGFMIHKIGATRYTTPVNPLITITVPSVKVLDPPN